MMSKARKKEAKLSSEKQIWYRPINYAFPKERREKLPKIYGMNLEGFGLDASSAPLKYS